MNARVLLPVALISVSALVLSACSPSSKERFSGDGVVAAPTGEHAFEVQFASIPISSPGEYTFRCSHLPPATMHALLAVDAPSPEVAKLIDQAGVSVRMELRGVVSSNEPERISVQDGLLEGQWRRTAQSLNADPLEYVAMWFTPRRHEEFELKFTVSLTDPAKLNGTDVSATPIIRGGQALRAAPSHRGSESVGMPSAGE